MTRREEPKPASPASGISAAQANATEVVSCLANERASIISFPYCKPNRGRRAKPHENRGNMIRALYAVALFVSAMLLFVVQPMVAKMILPLLGGTPAVWNTCLVFFQATLLVGYLYAHGLSRWLRPRGQCLWHLGMLLIPFLTLSWFLFPLQLMHEASLSLSTAP